MVSLLKITIVNYDACQARSKGHNLLGTRWRERSVSPIGTFLRLNVSRNAQTASASGTQRRPARAE